MSRSRLLLATALAVGLASAASAAASVRDPMRPPGVAGSGAGAARTAAPAEPVLSALFVSAGRRVAVIDGLTYAEGDSRDGLTVEAILADRVRVRRGGALRELRLAPVGAPVKRAVRSATVPGEPAR